MTADSRGGLTIIRGNDVLTQITGHRADCLDVISRGYLTHADGGSVLPHSVFVRPDPPRPDRFIALAGHLAGDFGVAGIKWIASYPDNVTAGRDRASAVLVLNDTRTGYPIAVLEGSVISATRTAASAVLAAEKLAGRRKAARVGIVGTGLIAAHVCLFLAELGWDVGGYTLHDTSRDRAHQFRARLLDGGATAARVTTDVADLFDECDLIVLATTANTPYLLDPILLTNAPLVLHLSLRDLGPNLIGVSQNITDDPEHAFRENTSLQVAERTLGDRAFLAGTIADVLTGRVARDGRPAIVAPFGLGVLDLALGQWVHRRCQDQGAVTTVPGFFPDPLR
jgi:ornithine cyclodeaminase